MNITLQKKTYRVVLARRGPQGAPGTGGGGGSGSGYGGTSTTINTIGTGTKTFTTQSGLAYAVGSRVRAINAASDWMEGNVTSYAGTTLVISSDLTSGSGTSSSWSFSIAGVRGATGATGATGPAGADGAAGATGATGAAGAGYGGTSSTSVSVGTFVPKIFTTQAGLAWANGVRVRAYSSGSGEYMDGFVGSYSGTTLSMYPDRASGSGTHTDWVFFIVGEVGPTGATGSTGATGATGPAGPAPSGTGLVSVSGGVLDTPTTLRARVAADPANLRSDLGLGTSATLNVAASGNAASGEVVKGSDTRLTDSRTPTSHTHTASEVTDFQEAVDDRVAALLVAGSNVTLTYNDASNTLTVAAAGSSGVADGDKGDITVSVSGTSWVIDASAVTYSKIQNISATNKILGRSTAGAGVIEEIDCTPAGRALIDDADAAAQRTTLGLGTLATQNGTFSGTSSGTNTGDQTITLSGDATGTGTSAITVTIPASTITLAKMANMATASILGRNTAGTGAPEVLAASTVRSLLSLVIGTNVQAWDADLDGLAALAANGIVARTGSGTYSPRTLTAPAAGITVSNGDGVSGNPTLALANDLAALEALGNGIPKRTGTDTWTSITTLPCEFCIACSDETTAITTGTNKARFRAPFAFTLTAVRASVSAAPTGSTIIIDINESGTTVMAVTKLSIDASESTSTTAASAAVISDSAIADDAEITIDFDQVGSSTAGAGVKVWLIGTRALP